MALEPVFTPEEVADHFRNVITPYWVRKRARLGLIDATQIGRDWFLTESQVNKLAAEGVQDGRRATKAHSKTNRSAPKPKAKPAESGNVRELRARPERARSYRQGRSA